MTAFEKLKFRGKNGANSAFHFHLVSHSQFAKCYHACTRICLGCNAKHTYVKPTPVACFQNKVMQFILSMEVHKDRFC